MNGMEPARDTQTSLEKALDVCETLAGSERGLTISELARALRQPPSTIHRLLAVLKRRGFVRQDEETTRYSLTLKMLDLSFKLLGRSELRLHAYPVLREYVLRTGFRTFIAVAGGGDVTYLWSAGQDSVGMHTVYGRLMPVHCAIYVERDAMRRLSCLRLEKATDALEPERVALRFGSPETRESAPLQRLLCTCAPVRDYTGREVARVGVFTHAAAEQPFASDQTSASLELARLISMRLGYLPGAFDAHPGSARPAERVMSRTG
jgi:IclR family transcriptional regulator, KDG regulon repressor